MQRAILVLGGVAMLLVGGVEVAAPQQGSQHGSLVPIGTKGCGRATLLQRPGWTTSGAWSSGGDHLFLADALNRTILTYTSTGTPEGPLSGTLGAALRNLSPAMLKPDGTGRGLLLEIEGVEGESRLLPLDNSFTPGLAQTVESSSPNHAQQRVSGLFQWEAMGRDLVTFGDIQGPKDTDWSSGIVRFPLGNPGDFKLLRPVELRSAERAFYRLGYQYLTSLGTTAYALTMGPTPGIYSDTNANGTKADGLIPVRNSLSDDHTELNPIIPDFRTRQDFVTVMGTVERSAMPTGIFGWRGNLYVLSRLPEAGQTVWLMRKFDRQHGTLLGTARIPSQASHLTAVPGPNQWAFVEKGPVKGYGIQDIKTILFVPSSFFTNIPAAFASASMVNAPSICQ